MQRDAKKRQSDRFSSAPSQRNRRQEERFDTRRPPLSPARSSITQAGRHQHRKRVQRRKKIVLFFLCLLIVGSILFFVLTRAPFFRIQSVRVEGNKVLTDREVMNALGDVDSNIFTFPTKRWKERLSQVEGIADAEFSRELPNRLVVKVKENFVLGVFTSAGRLYYVDEQGKITDHYVPEKNRLKPVVLEKEVEKIGIGEDFFSDARELEFLSTLQDMQLVDQVSKVRFEKPQRIVIMYNDIVIRFGRPNDIIHKFTDLDAVLREIEKKGVKAQEIILDEGQNPIVVTGNGQRISPDAKESGKGTGEN